MTRILLISTSFPEGGDGREAAGSFVLDFALALATQHEVRVLAPAMQAGVEQLAPALWVHRFAVPRLPLSLLKPARPADWLPLLYTLRAGSRAVKALHEQHPVTACFALWALPSGWWARQLWQKHGVPYANWALGSDIWTLGKVPLIKQVLQRVLRDARCNFADGLVLAEDVQRLSGRACDFLPSTRDLGDIRATAVRQQAPYTLAFLGRWHPNKGVDLLLDALALLNEHDWSRIAEVRIAGGGPLESTVKAACQALQAQGRPVVLQGYLDKNAAIAWFCSADYVLIPSRIESIPVVFSDAMQCGRPVVSMPVGDLPRLLRENSVGVLAKKVTAEDFSLAIQTAIQQSPADRSVPIRETANKFRLSVGVTRFISAVLNKKQNMHYTREKTYPSSKQ